MNSSNNSLKPCSTTSSPPHETNKKPFQTSNLKGLRLHYFHHHHKTLQKCKTSIKIQTLPASTTLYSKSQKPPHSICSSPASLPLSSCLSCKPFTTGSTFNFSRKNIFAGILCITLSVSTSLWEHSHIPSIAAFFITEENSWAELNTLTSFLQIIIWIGLGLELLIVASTFGKVSEQPLPNRQQPQQPRKYSQNSEDAFDLDSLMNGNGAKR